MKPSPLSAVLADDLLLDQVGARLDTDDGLGVLLLAVAHHADTPIPPAVPTRRRRSHRGLTVLAALGVAVSGATVAAAVELAPTPPDQASGMPHTRTFLPRSLQALVMPFLAGTPFQGRLVLPFGSLPTVPFVGTTADGLPGTAFPIDAFALPTSTASPSADSESGNQEQQDLSRQKTEAKGTQSTGLGQTGNQVNQSGAGTTDAAGEGDGADQPQTAPTPKPPKPTPTPAPTPAQTGEANGATNGAANGQGATNGQGGGRGRTPTGTTTGGTTTDGTTDGTGDDPVSGGPDKHGAVMGSTATATSTGPAPGQAKTAPATPTPASGTARTVATTDGTVTP